jgi:hypothetical protein
VQLYRRELERRTKFGIVCIGIVVWVCSQIAGTAVCVRVCVCARACVCMCDAHNTLLRGRRSVRGHAAARQVQRERQRGDIPLVHRDHRYACGVVLCVVCLCMHADHARAHAAYLGLSVWALFALIRSIRALRAAGQVRARARVCVYAASTRCLLYDRTLHCRQRSLSSTSDCF